MKRKMMIGALIGFFIILPVIPLGLSVLNRSFLPEDGISEAFEQNYAEISAVACFLMSMEEAEVYIEMDAGGSSRIKGEYGKLLNFQSREIEQIIGELKKKGYDHIMKRDQAVVFDIWRKPFDAEFEAGFAYSADGTGDLSAIQFLIRQDPLPEEKWYYYEADYNEWRSNQTSDDFDGE